jgi:hypothetical protein
VLSGRNSTVDLLARPEQWLSGGDTDCCEPSFGADLDDSLSQGMKRLRRATGSIGCGSMFLPRGRPSLPVIHHPSSAGRSEQPVRFNKLTS